MDVQSFFQRCQNLHSAHRFVLKRLDDSLYHALKRGLQFLLRMCFCHCSVLLVVPVYHVRQGLRQHVDVLAPPGGATSSQRAPTSGDRVLLMQRLQSFCHSAHMSPLSPQKKPHRTSPAITAHGKQGTERNNEARPGPSPEGARLHTDQPDRPPTSVCVGVLSYCVCETNETQPRCSRQQQTFVVN